MLDYLFIFENQNCRVQDYDRDDNYIHFFQVVIRGTEKAFTYDFAFASDTSQGYVYESAVKKVVQNLFNGNFFLG